MADDDLNLDDWDDAVAEGNADSISVSGEPCTQSHVAPSNLLECAADDFGWGDETEIQYATDELDDWHDGAGFLPLNWPMDQAAITQILAAYGLVGERLAEQYGDAEAVLEQVLQQLNLTIGLNQKAYHLRELENMIFLARQQGPMNKRLRGENQTASLQRVTDSLIHSQAGAKPSEKTVESWPEVQVQLPSKGQRRWRQLMISYPGQSKAAVEERRRMNCIDKVVRLIERGDVPLMQIAKASQDPHRIITGAIGSTRAGTLETYHRSFAQFLDFLFMQKGTHWPVQVNEVLEYLHLRCSEPCSPTVPQTFLQALCWFEKVAAVSVGDRLGTQEIVRRTCDYVMEQTAGGASTLKQAPRLTRSLLASLELYVVDESRSPGKRLKAFSILLKTYCTLREDDIQNLRPKSIRAIGDLVGAELLRTKTTGRTKRVKELPLALWAGTSITGEPWIEAGMLLLSTFGQEDRDHLLPNMSRDGKTSCQGPLSYASSAALTQQVVGELGRPEFSQDKWIMGVSKLVHPSMVSFWSEHSPRSVMPSMLAVLEVSKDKIDYCGKWSPTGSQDYTRTFRVVVKTLQQQIIQAVHKADARLDEADVLDRLKRYCSDKEFSETLSEQVCSHFKDTCADFDRQLAKPEFKTWVPHQIQLGSGEVVAAIPVQRNVTTKQSADRKKRFLLVYSNNKKFARLHKLIDTRCPWVTVQLNDCVELDTAQPSMYNSRCKICWPRQSNEDESLSSESEH